MSRTSVTRTPCNQIHRLAFNIQTQTNIFGSEELKEQFMTIVSRRKAKNKLRYRYHT
jgi:hypothetical protein